MKKSNGHFYLISLVSLFTFILLQLFDPSFLRERVESKTFDLRLQLRNLVKEQPLREDIVIVAVDENSLAETGRWPWSRTVMAKLVNKIAQGKPKVIGIDIMFPEGESREADSQLARALREAGNVVLSMAFILPQENEDNNLPVTAPDFIWDSAFMEVKAVSGIDWKKWAVKPARILPPIEEIGRGVVLGHTTANADKDGVLRYEILSLNNGDDCYPSLALQVARLAQGLKMDDMAVYGGSAVKLGDRLIQTDLSGQALINYRGKENSFQYVSASDVLQGRIGSGTFRGKIVLFGTSALATYDLKVTPFSGNMPGIEKNANVVQNILLNNFIRKSPGVVELGTILFTSLILILFLPRLSAKKGVLLGFGLIGSYFALSNILLFYQNILINLVAPVANMTLILTTETITKLLTEERQAREIREMFSSYVSPKIVEVLVNNPEKAVLGGERRTVTILFSDMIGFTTLSEKLPPEEVVAMLNDYFKEMAEIIFRWDGTLDKFVGDEIMAIWGAPVDQPKHAELAMRCALNMSDRLDRLQEKWREEGRFIIDCGIGINSGEVVIGNIGWQGKKMDYTAIGNNVNIAARVEKLTRNYGSRILITGNTHDIIKPLLDQGEIGHVECRGHEAVKVRGKQEEVQIFSVKSLPAD